MQLQQKPWAMPPTPTPPRTPGRLPGSASKEGSCEGPHQDAGLLLLSESQSRSWNLGFKNSTAGLLRDKVGL